MKQIIISSLQYLVDEGRVKKYGFILMPNHFHLLTAASVFLKHTMLSMTIDELEAVREKKIAELLGR
jgi:hypothetical protein